MLLQFVLPTVRAHKFGVLEVIVRAKNRYLWHRKRHSYRFWQFSVGANSVMTLTWIRVHHLQRFAYYAEVLSANEGIMGNRIKRSRSNMTSTVASFWSRERRMSFCTLNKADLLNETAYKQTDGLHEVYVQIGVFQVGNRQLSQEPLRQTVN